MLTTIFLSHGSIGHCADRAQPRKVTGKIAENDRQKHRPDRDCGPRVLGGLRLDMDGTRLDGTVQRHLERLRTEIDGAVL